MRGLRLVDPHLGWCLKGNPSLAIAFSFSSLCLTTTCSETFEPSLFSGDHPLLSPTLVLFLANMSSGKHSLPFSQASRFPRVFLWFLEEQDAWKE